MDLDTVHEMNSFSDQMMMPVHSNLLDENLLLEAAFSYDDLFPSLPENEMRPATPVVDIGQWTQKMKVKSSVITQMFRVSMEERKFPDVNSQRFGEQGEQAKICSDIMQRTGAHIEISSSKDQSLTILITGKEEAVLKARRQVIRDMTKQVVKFVPIPKEHHRFILGKSGKLLSQLELSTATKISVPRPEDNSDLIKIIGSKEGTDEAQHEIEAISLEKGKLGFECLRIEKPYHPFIFGPHNKTLISLKETTGARINIPPPSVMKDELTIAGEKEAVAEAKRAIDEIYERVKKYQAVCVEVPKNQHKYIIGRRGEAIQEILAETGVSVEMPPADKQSDTITLRGDQVHLGSALTMVYSKANSVKTEHMEVPSWLHKYIIGKKGANIKNLTQDFPKVQVDFSEDSIKVEGDPKEVDQTCGKLQDLIQDLRTRVAYEEMKINPQFHRHIIGKNGANINRLKEETKTLINIPQGSDNNIVRMEGPHEGVAQVKKELQEMVSKMENEVTKDIIIEQRFHRNIIGTKGENIRVVRDQFNQVNVTFPEPGLKSDKVNIRGPKADVEACYKHLRHMNEEMKLTNFSVDVPVYKQNHKFIIGKGGANIKKIRDETNTRIDLPAEGADSEVITIRGRREDVLKAKEQIMAMNEDLDNVITQEIMIPAKLHNSIIGTNGKLIRSITEDCGGVTIKFPNSGSGSDKVSIRGPKDDVAKAKKLLIELSNERQENSYTAEIKAHAEQHKFLIGKHGVNIKKVRDKTGARIVFPNEGDEDRDTITIIGRKEDVEAAKEELTSIIAELANTSDTTTEIDPKHHRHFVARRAEVLNQIAEEFGGVKVSFPKREFNSSTVTLKGAKDFLEGAKQRLHDIVKELDAMVTVECIIPQEHHRTVLGTKGAKVQNIQKEFNVTIKLPDRERRPEENGNGVNGDVNPDEANLRPEVDSKRNIITIKGHLENCEAAHKALLGLVPITEEMEVPYDLHRFIIGQKGKDVRYLMETYDVNIIIPQQSEGSDVITIKGPPENVEKTKVALKERIEQLELEKQERLLRSFQLSIEVDPVHHPKIIGSKGNVVNKIRKDFKVNINFPERDSSNERVITITGYEQDAEAAKEAILKLVQEQEEMHKEEVEIDHRVHSRIIGGKGRTVRKIMDDFKVDIRFPRSSDPDSNPNLVVINGSEDNVLDAKDHLLNLEEEFLQEAKEKDYMRQYTTPPSRNGTCDGDINWRDDKGFVVKGAPWDRKNAVPDTTNTQEFPSFGTGGEVPPKSVIWGPSRR